MLVSMVFSPIVTAGGNSVVFDNMSTVASNVYDLTLTIDFSPGADKVSITFIDQTATMSLHAARALSAS